MYQFPLFETISIRYGEVQNIKFHQERFNFACQTYFQVSPFLTLSEIIQPSEETKQGLYRCRLVYNRSEFQLHFYPYQAKTINQFKLVYTNNLDYRFKYTDRRFFQGIKLTENEEAIIINNGKVSDCTIGNLLFSQEGRWYSPKDYLLKGTQLSRLLEEEQVELIDITPKDLPYFEQVMYINALNPFEHQRALPIQAVDLAKILQSA